MCQIWHMITTAELFFLNLSSMYLWKKVESPPLPFCGYPYLEAFIEFDSICAQQRITLIDS